MTTVVGDQSPTADVSERLKTSIDRTVQFFRDKQAPDGHWVAELEGDTILESEYILLLAFLGQGQTEAARLAGEYIRRHQEPHGGWANFPGGPLEISCSAKAYLALKITGHDPQADYMVRARQAIIAAGGVEKVNSFTRFYFAMLGLIPYSLCPAVPPELILLPEWAPFNVGEMSAWSRTIVIPLSLLWAFRPRVKLPPEHGIDELYAHPEKGFSRFIHGVNHAGSESTFFSWTKFFQFVDQGVKLCENVGLKPLRRRAVRLCEQWILQRLEGSDGLGAIFPPIIWTIIGLRCLGYPDDSPVIQQQFRELEKLMIREPETLRLQPCLSPVWDTAITTIALRDAGVERKDPAIQRAVSWLLSKEVRRKGDWSAYRPTTEPGGWYFEFNNEFYPDVDDTCMVLIALGRCLPSGLGREWGLELVHSPGQSAADAVLIRGSSATAAAAVKELEASQPMLEAIRRGVNWLRAMQSRDGGWGAFDADNTREVLTKVPFADHNAMIDPSTADISARVLESYAGLGIDPERPDIQKALAFIFADQQPDHCWFGRWGVNYIYGTWQVIVGLVATGIPANDPRIQRAAEWLVSKQQTSGGWGETIATYDDPSLRGTGTPTASQTAWAVLGLIAAGQVHSVAVRRGIEFLLSTQLPDGTWDEPEFTGTGFPRVFYLRYHYYSIYFPLMALGRYARLSVAGECSVEC